MKAMLYSFQVSEVFEADSFPCHQRECGRKSEGKIWPKKKGDGLILKHAARKAEIKAQKIMSYRRCVNLVHGQANTNVLTNTCERHKKTALTISE